MESYVTVLLGKENLYNKSATINMKSKSDKFL